MPEAPQKPAHALLRQPKGQASPAFAPVAAGEAVPFQPVAVMNPASQILGDAGSSEALKAVLEHVGTVKRIDTLVLLKEALVRFRGGDWNGGGECALQALHVDEKCGEAWQILAIARDKCNDFTTALTCYETALRLLPDNVAIGNDLGRLAFRMGENVMAEKFFRWFLDRCPGHPEAVNNLATVLRDESRFEESIALLQATIPVHPADPQLWNALGTVVNAQGDLATSAIFYEEALKHDPGHVHARYNLGNTRASLGDVDGGLKDLLTALPVFVDAPNIHTCKLSIAFCYLMKGDYEQGWSWYEARHKDDMPDRMTHLIGRPRWGKRQSLRGKRIFVSAEQGLGDEIMFASILPDLLEEIGPEGHLGIGVESRLVPLFRKGFPTASVFRHHTTKYKGSPVRLFPDVADWESYDAWAIMGDFLARYRRKPADFPKSNVFFHPDPERVAYWKAILNGVNNKPKVGVLWKSLVRNARRDRYYSPFEQWKEVLKVEGVQFVNLQYGDTTEEMAEAAGMGLDIWTPPGIDLKNDLDDLSALCVAMDCVLGPANATSNIAGAAGACVWLLGTPNSWNCLGQDYFPWYPTVRVFAPDDLLDWSPALNAIRDALIDTFAEHDGASHAA